MVYPRPILAERACLGVISHIVVVCELRDVGIDRMQDGGSQMGRFTVDLEERAESRPLFDAILRGSLTISRGPWKKKSEPRGPRWMCGGGGDR